MVKKNATKIFTWYEDFFLRGVQYRPKTKVNMEWTSLVGDYNSINTLPETSSRGV